MKATLLLILLLAAIPAVAPAVVMTVGENFEHSFGPLDLKNVGPVSADDGVGWSVFFSQIGAAPASIRVELLEDVSGATPFYSSNFVAPSEPDSIGGHVLIPLSWRDYQGIVKVTVLTGTVNVSKIHGIVYDRQIKHLAIENFAETDSDLDGLSDLSETDTGVFVSAVNTGSDPSNPDSDGDGLRDGDEVIVHGSDPNKTDSDSDGFDDGFEVETGFDPASATSTPDAKSSIRTAVELRFNAASGETYRVEASTDLKNWTTVEDNIPGTGGVTARFYSTESFPVRMFRVRRN
jgi:hypothetical protein